MRRRPLPDVPELIAALAEQGVTDAPREAADLETLKGLLDTALFVAEHRKRVAFEPFNWAEPAFTATDGRATLRLAYARMREGTVAELDALVDENLARLADGRTLLVLDAHATDAREFELGHHLYGEVTLFSWPHKPPQPHDARIDAARERGWVKTLKEHNLLPGRGIVVLDEHQGRVLRDPRMADVLGFLVLLPDGHHHLWWNPVVRDDANDPELQYWLTWGEGTGAPSAWREVLHVSERDDGW